MRQLLIALLLCSCAAAQDATPVQGPDFSRAARQRGAFYLNGIGHQYIQGKNFTVVAAAIPTLNGKYLGVKLHVFNRSKKSLNMLPESVTVEDSVGAKVLELFSASEIADHMRRQPTWMRVAGAAVGGAPAPPMTGTDPNVPHHSRPATRAEQGRRWKWNGEGIRGYFVSDADGTGNAESPCL